MRIEIGGGTRPEAGYTNVDPVHGVAPFNRRIQDGLPTVTTGTVEGAWASHVFEHIPQGAERIAALNEIHRVLAPGAIFHMIVPCVGWTDHPDLNHDPHDPVDAMRDGRPHHCGWQPYADPTHVSFWWFPESWLYLVEGPFKANASYGLAEWKMGHAVLKDGWEAHVDLIKPGG